MVARLGELWTAAAAGDETAWQQLAADWAQTIWELLSSHRAESFDFMEVCEVVWLRQVDALESGAPWRPEAMFNWLADIVAEEVAKAVAQGDLRSVTGGESPAEPETHTETSDLVAAAAAGDGRAWQALVDRYAGLIWAITRNFRLGSDDAADVSQTTWLRLVENLDRLTDPARVGSWLATTARRECIRLVGNNKRQVLVGDDRALDIIDLSQPEVDLELLKAERAEEVQRAFARCPGRCQDLLHLLMLEPAPSYEEISAALGIPIGSIGPTRGRCLAKIRAILDASSNDPLVSRR